MTSKKKVNLVFYGDFGLRKGKGEEAWATAEALFRAGLLGKVYVRDNGDCTVGDTCDCSNGVAVPGNTWQVLSRNAPDVVRILYIPKI